MTDEEYKKLCSIEDPKEQLEYMKQWDEEHKHDGLKAIIWGIIILVMFCASDWGQRFFSMSPGFIIADILLVILLFAYIGSR